MKRFRSLVYSLVVSVCVSVPVAAEDSNRTLVTEHRSFFGLLFPDYSALKAAYRYQPDNKEDGGPGKFDLQTFDFRAELPYATSEDTFFRFGAEYGARMYDFSKVSGSPIDEGTDTFHRIVLIAGYGMFFSSDLLLTGSVRPGLYSDFNDGVNEDGLRLYGEAMLVYQLNLGTQILIGFEYSERYDDVPYLPLAGIRIMNSEGTLHIALTFPTEARLAYNAAPDFQVYTGLWASGDEYRVKPSGMKEKANASVADRYWGAGVQYWFTENFNLGAEAGLTLDDQLDIKSDSARQLAGDIEPTPYFKANFGLAF